MLQVPSSLLQAGCQQIQSRAKPQNQRPKLQAQNILRASGNRTNSPAMLIRIRQARRCASTCRSYYKNSKTRTTHMGMHKRPQCQPSTVRSPMQNKRPLHLPAAMPCLPKASCQSEKQLLCAPMLQNNLCNFVCVPFYSVCMPVPGRRNQAQTPAAF